MRYDTAVIFRQLERGDYDDATGDYSPEKVVLVEARTAAVIDSTIETMKLIYGEIRQNSKTIHLQNKVGECYNNVLIGSKPYRIDMRKNLRNKQILVVSEAI